MSGFLVYFTVIYILVAALMVGHPWMSRKNVLFGVVFGSAEIRSNREAKRITGRFVAASVILAILPEAVFAFLVATGTRSDADAALIFTLAVFALILLEFIPYVVANRAVKALKKTIVDENLVRDRITVDLGAQAAREKKPVFAAWFLLLLAPVAISALLAAHYYPSMPDSIATHFNAAGAADAWQAKSMGVLMFPITMQIVLGTVLFLVGIFMRNAPSAVRGSPGAAPGYNAFRRFLVYWLIGFGAVVQVNFLFIILLYAGVLQSMAVWNNVFIALVVAAAVLLAGAFARMRRRAPEGKVYDDDSRWKAGMFYFNPSDPSVFVEKRTGIGQTLNFGHPAAWIVIGAIIAFVIFSASLGAGK